MPGTIAYNTVLGNVTNLKKAFASDEVQVEVVCHGEGINMLFVSDKTLSGRVKKAYDSGVVFAACANTLRGKHIDKSRIVPFAQVVDAGVAERDIAAELRQIETALGMPLTAWKGRMLTAYGA